MSHVNRALSVLSLTLFAALVGAADAPAPPAYRTSEPATHDNLTIFFLHGADAVPGRKFLTLEEALTQKKVVVHETKNVNNLQIENVSSDEVFVQAGDIVKGGQQDRTIAHDMIVPGKSGKLDLGSFCVENGRWARRGTEAAERFGSAGYQLSDNGTKYAARSAKDQGKVWENVSKAQIQLAAKLKTEVRDKASSSSLQLTLENKKVGEAVDAFVKKLQTALDKQTDVIGYAVVINGKVNNAEVYANADLFRKLWPKLIRASALEAVANRKEGAKIEPVKAKAVQAFLAEVAKGKRESSKVGVDLRETVQTSDKAVLFETRCKDGKGECLRSSYIAK
jgi:hypothetical protein